MTDVPDPVIAAGLEYETATLLAVHALKETDVEAQRAAVQRWIVAVNTIESLDVEDYNRAGAFVQERARIKEGDWRTVAAAMERFFSEAASAH